MNGLQDIQETTIIVPLTDYTHVLRLDTNKIFLSNKSIANSLTTVFSSTEEANSILARISAIKTKYDSLSAIFIDKKETEKSYVSKDTLESTLPSILNSTELDSDIEQHANQDNLNAKNSLATKETNALAIEMTDYVGAAMVGINQTVGG